MLFYKTKGNGGFVKMILLIVIALIVLGYLGYNIENIMNSPTVKGNLTYVWDLVKIVWDKFLATPASFIWNKIIIELGWDNLQKLIGAGQ